MTGGVRKIVLHVVYNKLTRCHTHDLGPYVQQNLIKVYEKANPGSDCNNVFFQRRHDHIKCITCHKKHLQTHVDKFCKTCKCRFSVSREKSYYQNCRDCQRSHHQKKDAANRATYKRSQAAAVARSRARRDTNPSTGNWSRVTSRNRPGRYPHHRPSCIRCNSSSHVQVSQHTRGVAYCTSCNGAFEFAV